jgi:hypothetical protein
MRDVVLSMMKTKSGQAILKYMLEIIINHLIHMSNKHHFQGKEIQFTREFLESEKYKILTGKSTIDL